MKEKWKGREVLFIFTLLITIEIFFNYSQFVFIPVILETIAANSKKIAILFYVFGIRIIDLIVIIYFVIIIKKNGISGLGLSLENIWKKVVFGLSICLIFGFCVLSAEVAYYGVYGKDLLKTALVPKSGSPFKDIKYLLSYLTVAVLFAPFVEEIVFRGILYPMLRRKINMPFAILLNAIIFASAHGKLSVFFLIQVIGGIVFAFLFEKTGSIIPGYIVHSVGNFTIVGVVCFYTA